MTVEFRVLVVLQVPNKRDDSIIYFDRPIVNIPLRRTIGLMSQDYSNLQSTMFPSGFRIVDPPSVSKSPQREMYIVNFTGKCEFISINNYIYRDTQTLVFASCRSSMSGLESSRNHGSDVEVRNCQIDQFPACFPSHLPFPGPDKRGQISAATSLTLIVLPKY